MNLLLIDGNNLAFRVHWTHKKLTSKGVPVSLLYGFFRSLVALRKKFPNYFPVVAWDGVYDRRLAESKIAVEEGLIPSEYKANRKREPDEALPPDIQCMFEQLPVLKEGLKFARVMQVTRKGVEADDIIYTYAKYNDENGGLNVIVTSDQDYYQVLSENTHVYDAMKTNYWTRKVFIENFGFEPALWVDVGALAGDSSDNIHGVPGVGEKWAVKFVKEYGDVDCVLSGLSCKEKRKKKEQAVLDNEKRLRVARSLKKMDKIDALPGLKCAPRKAEPLLQWFDQFRFETLKPDAWRLL